jgi:hypothetical protein
VRNEPGGGVIGLSHKEGTRKLLSLEDGGTVYQAYLVRMPNDMTAALRPQDRPRWPGGARLLTSLLSLLVIAAVIYEIRGVHLHAILALIPSSSAFWAIFALSYLAQPITEWLIFRRLWNVGPSAFGALVRKLIYNELLLGYLGEVFFYAWARRLLKLEAAPFGAVKDVTILSAVAGNVMTLLMLAIAWPLASATELGLQTRAVVLSLSVVLITSMALLLWRRQIFSLPRPDLRFIFSLHIARILAATGLSALLWHLVLPSIPLVWWLLLATIRLLISRLPFVPNKDVVFAGLAVFMLGHDVDIASLLTLMAGLILMTHLLVGTTFAISDLVRRESSV